MSDPQSIATAVFTLFVVIDPIGMAPLFIALTSGMDDAHRAAVGRRACLIAAAVLAIFGLAGTAILGGLGISLAAFRIAGGLLLFLIAVEMLFERRTRRREGQTERDAGEPDQDPSVFPLATPLIAGPGAMAAMILLTSGDEAGWGSRAIVLAAMLANVALVLALFRLAAPIERALGRTGILVVTRLLGMLLAALSVQFVLDGLAGVGLLSGSGPVTSRVPAPI